MTKVNATGKDDPIVVALEQRRKDLTERLAQAAADEQAAKVEIDRTDRALSIMRNGSSQPKPAKRTPRPAKPVATAVAKRGGARRGRPPGVKKQGKSVRAMVLELLASHPSRDFSTKEIFAHYEAKGTPIVTGNPDSAVRQALDDFKKSGQIVPTTSGRYQIAAASRAVAS